MNKQKCDELQMFNIQMKRALLFSFETEFVQQIWAKTLWQDWCCSVFSGFQNVELCRSWRLNVECGWLCNFLLWQHFQWLFSCTTVLVALQHHVACEWLNKISSAQSQHVCLIGWNDWFSSSVSLWLGDKLFRKRVYFSNPPTQKKSCATIFLGVHRASFWSN